MARFGSPVTRSQGLLDGDSELEEAAQLYGVGMPQLRPRSSPASSSTPGTSPARGRAGRSPGSSRGKSPGRGKSPSRGKSPARGRSPKGVPGGAKPPTGAGRSIPVGAGRSVPVGLPLADPPRPNRLRGFLSGKGGGALRTEPKPTLDEATATTSTGKNSLKRLLPSFASDDDYDTAAEGGARGGDQDYTPTEDDDDEVTFKNRAEPPRKRLKTVPVAKKNLNLIKGNRKRGPSAFKRVSNENKLVRTLAHNETKRGWYKRPKKKEGAPKFKSGTVALREIRFYQKSRVLLIPMRAFIRFVRELALEHKTVDGGHFRWQAGALYALQQAAEAYLVGLFDNIVILAIHCKRFTIMRQDITMVLRLRGRQPVRWPMGDT